MTSPSTTEDAPGLDQVALKELLSRQSGVVSRRQILELGGRDWDIRRMVRAKVLVAVHPGVYVEHTGELSAAQRRWSAVLVHWPAALTRESALPGHADDEVVHVAIAHGRKVRKIPGVQTHRTCDLDRRVRWNLSPPAVVLEEAALDVALGSVDLLGRFETLASVCRSRRTTPERLVEALARRKRVAGRALLAEMLADLESGACSVLEREYLRLEQRHSLPVGDRQRPAAVGKRRAYVDVDYPAYRTRVELDGRAYHGGTGSWEDDHERDLAASVTSEEVTLRLSYGQVFRHGCRTIGQVAWVLQRNGWEGSLRRCPLCADSEDVTKGTHRQIWHSVPHRS